MLWQPCHPQCCHTAVNAMSPPCWGGWHCVASSTAPWFWEGIFIRHLLTKLYSTHVQPFGLPELLSQCSCSKTCSGAWGGSTLDALWTCVSLTVRSGGWENDGERICMGCMYCPCWWALPFAKDAKHEALFIFLFFDAVTMLCGSKINAARCGY